MNSGFYTEYSEVGKGWIVRFTGKVHGIERKGAHVAFFSEAEHAERFARESNESLRKSGLLEVYE